MMAHRVVLCREAPALRFLILCVGGWAVLRIMTVWNPTLPMQPDAVAQPWMPQGRKDPHIADLYAISTTRIRPDNSPVLTRSSPRRVGAPGEAKAEYGRAGAGAGRHNDRVASPAVSALPWFPLAPADQASAKPIGLPRPLSGWSLAGWLYVRDGAGKAAETIGAASQLGGSQAGLRIVYGFGASGRVRAYGRATVAVQRLDQREIAFGLAVAPFTRLPVDVAIEQRVGVGKGGRTALAAMVTGGVSDIALPARFRLEAYAQAGMVGARRRDGFADGAIVVDRRVGADEASLFRFGVVVAAAVQPGASRVDVGPRLTIRLPDVGEGGRIALDWRQRIAGDASPESGVALTVAAAF